MNPKSKDESGGSASEWTLMLAGYAFWLPGLTQRLTWREVGCWADDDNQSFLRRYLQEFKEKLVPVGMLKTGRKVQFVGKGLCYIRELSQCSAI